MISFGKRHNRTEITYTEVSEVKNLDTVGKNE